jgi:hypothetical protein
MKEDIYGSHFPLILGCEYLKERKLLLAKGNVCGLFELVPCCTKLLEK